MIYLGIDSDTTVNGQILNSDAATVTTLDISNGPINSLNGISAFINLQQLTCSYNNLTNLDLSNNTALTYLNCYSNDLTSLNLSNNTALTTLNCTENNLSSLGLSNNIALTNLSCHENNLVNLDVSNNIMLTVLWCANNNLTSLNLINNTVLSTLNCHTNNIANLDVSNNIMLTVLQCGNNSLTNLDVNNNTALSILNCNINNITNLDVSNNTMLTELWCDNNSLTNLDVSNNTTLSIFSCLNNLPTMEIWVPSIAVANSNSSFYKDPSATWVENCAFSKAAVGIITIDTNNNCTADSTEQKWPNQLLKFEKGATTIYAATNDSGNYIAHLDTGAYTASVAEDNHPYWAACPSSQTVTVDTNYNLQTVDFVVQSNIQCPYLEVDISAPFLRRCFDNNYYVTYCNKGTVTAPNAYVEVELDTTLYYNSSTATLLSQVGNIYRFDEGNVAVGECGSFSIDVTVSCNAQLGQVHCAEAHIYPDSLCLSSINDIQVIDSCSNYTILYQVTNYADVFVSPLSYLILEDTTVVDTGSIQLNMGQSITIGYYTGGSTKQYQLLIAQGNSDYYTISHRQSCNSNTINMEMPYHPTVQHPSIAFDCQNNRGSYDPNDKRALQKGAGLAHYIYPNTALEYHIRFQNTGTDTAIFINILDTLSPFLNVASLQMGASSHPYTWELRPAKPTGEKVLKITFDPIYLLDSNVNEAASHGFIKFKINQVPNLPNQTLIENNAAIYFDYNAPIITNTAFHTVCDNCLDINITGNGGVITSTLATEDAQSFQIYPNPSTGQLYIQQASAAEATLSLYNINGQQLLQQQTQQQLTTLNLQTYPAGAYILQVQTAKGTENYKVIRQ
ncbi:MAG: T9SS type A sorting domain-containing protein [Aureispira sp.]|nr:T9SS type A sorting domain-containing protein [Aureispira sp.]